MLKPVVGVSSDDGVAVMSAELMGVPDSVQPRLKTDNSNKVIGSCVLNTASLLKLKSICANPNKKRVHPCTLLYHHDCNSLYPSHLGGLHQHDKNNKLNLFNLLGC